jgi:hypothetical protein
LKEGGEERERRGEKERGGKKGERYFFTLAHK